MEIIAGLQQLLHELGEAEDFGDGTWVIVLIVASIALPIVLTIGALIFAFRASGFGDRKLLKTGRQARAIVKELRQTSMRINEVWRYELDLEVHPEGEEPFLAQTKRVIPVHQIMHAQPGSELVVRYDPENREKRVAIEAFGATEEDSREFQISSQGELLKIITEQQAEHTRLNDIGLEARAIVVAQHDSTARVNKIGAVLRLDVKVIRADATTYDASMVSVVHQDRLDRYDVGSEIPIRFDPSDPTKICVDSSRSSISNPDD